MHLKSKATSVCLSIARFVEGITNTAGQALDNFRFFSVSHWIGKMGVKCPSYYETTLFYGFHSTAVCHPQKLNVMSVKEVRLKSR